MFGRSRRKQQSAAATIVTPRPAPQYQAQPANPWPWVVFGSIVAVPFFCWLTWAGGVYVFDQAGAINPGRTMATTVIGVSFAVLVFAGSILAGKAILNDYWTHREALQEIVNDGLRYKMTMAQTPVPSGRLTEKDKKWWSIIRAVMFAAYSQMDDTGQLTGRSRPWSRRQVLAIQLTNGETPTEGEAAAVRGWLEKYGVIIDDAIDINRFPTADAVDQLLARLYDVPVTVSRSPALLRDNSGYQHIS